MNDSDTAGMVAGRREVDTNVCAQMQQFARTNARLRVGLAGVLMLGIGFGLGGLAQQDEDSVVAYTATGEVMYRVYESGLIEYLRLDADPPRTAHGVFDWGVVRIDDRYVLEERP